MTNKILCILPICCNPSNKDSCKGEKRIIQYVDGLKKFFEYSDILKEFNVNVYIFDNTLSPWLNQANKLGYINNFSYSPIAVKFNIEKNKLDLFKSILPAEFILL